MKCLACTSPEQRVMSTRDGDARITRLRRCDACGHRWNTVELSTDEVQKLGAAARAMRAFMQACEELGDVAG